MIANRDWSLPHKVRLLVEARPESVAEWIVRFVVALCVVSAIAGYVCTRFA